MDRRPLSAVELERTIQAMLDSLALGTRPSRASVDSVRSDVSRLPRTDGSVPSWQLAELDASVRELVQRALPTTSGRRLVRDVEEVVAQERPSSSGDDDAAFAALRRRVDAVHDIVEAGRRPTRKTFDDLHAELMAYLRGHDGPEVRQMIDDVRSFRRTVLAASRSTTPSGLASSRSGHGFWSRSVSERPTRRPRPVRRRRSPQAAAQVDAPISGERLRLLQESQGLRDRAGRFAAALPKGRTFPFQETDRLFLHFKNIRSSLDSETQALNDAAVRELVHAVLVARNQPRTTPGGSTAARGARE